MNTNILEKYELSGTLTKVGSNDWAIAEDEIGKAKIKHPEKAEQIHWLFWSLRKTNPLVQLSAKLYRKHCQELIARFVVGADLDPATDAEIMGYLVHLGFEGHNTLEAPAMGVIARIFEKHYPDTYQHFLQAADMTIEMPESYPGRFDEVEADLRKRLAVKNRAWHDETGKQLLGL